MIRVNAGWIIAMVTKAHPIWDIAAIYCPRYMSRITKGFLVEPKLAVPVSIN